MKKVLLTSTALVAFAGAASAQGVEISGSAEMGIVGGSGMETQFLQSVDVRFTMTGETDNGLSFGATIDLDDLADGAISTNSTTETSETTGIDPVDVTGGQFADFTVFLSGDFGTVTMGDTDGGFDWALTEVNIGGSINDAETGHSGFNGNAGLDGNYDGQVVRYDHSIGDFSFAVSVEIDDTGAGDPIFGIGGKYSADLGGTTLGIGVGYQTGGPGASDEAVGISLSTSFDNGLQARLNYSDVTEGTVDYNHTAIGLGYTMDALTIGLNYGQYDHSSTSTGTDADGFGLAVNYDLGGGAVVQFGYGTGTVSGASSVDSWSLGVAMSF